MKTLVIGVAILFCVQQVSSQCLTENDSPRKDPNLDLSSITNFGLELFREVFPYNTSKNFFFSPYSIWNALVLAYFGSDGYTELQLMKALNVTDKVATLQNFRHLQYLYDVRQKNVSQYTFALANKAYFDKSVNPKKCLHNLLPKEIEKLDFAKSMKAAQIINLFVEKTTKSRINNIVKPSDLTGSRMALVNAAFFKGTWQSQFKKSRTTKQIFYTSPEQYYFVDMMNQKGRFRNGISEELGAHLLELPYNGEDISMVILLPPFIAGDVGFNNMVKRLNAELLHSTLESLWRGEVNISLPKFSLKESLGNELIEALQKMGVKDLFDPIKANLTLFNAGGHLSVGKSIHKAFVEVNEEGTEAAAATSMVEFRLARPLMPEEFVCNHPFLFVIFDNVTKNILFLGAYKHPKK